MLDRLVTAIVSAIIVCMIIGGTIIAQEYARRPNPEPFASWMVVDKF